MAPCRARDLPWLLYSGFAPGLVFLWLGHHRSYHTEEQRHAQKTKLDRYILLLE